TDTAGNQMREGDDVKVRGLRVGEVRPITTDSSKAVLELAIERDRIGAVPSNVSARLLPKTLFGERYVALRIPSDGSDASETDSAVSDTGGSRTLAEGDVIPHDRSESAVELERVLSNVLPLLQAVEPQKLAGTLSAVSTALEGRGEQLGETLVDLSDYLREFNPSLPDLSHEDRKSTRLNSSHVKIS